jgi:hypothetical protein
MFKKLVALSLVALLINLLGMTTAYAVSKEEKQARFAVKVKENVMKLGTGEAARVKVKLRDKSKLEGYISAADEDSFTITDSSGKATTVPYRQVKSVKGNNLSSGAKIAIGVGIAAAIIFLILWQTTGPGSD